jgi:hypothetical protein
VFGGQLLGACGLHGTDPDPIKDIKILPTVASLFRRSEEPSLKKQITVFKKIIGQLGKPEIETNVLPHRNRVTRKPQPTGWERGEESFRDILDDTGWTWLSVRSVRGPSETAATRPSIFSTAFLFCRRSLRNPCAIAESGFRPS